MNKPNKGLTCMFILSSLFFCANTLIAQAPNSTCDFWHSKVIPEIRTEVKSAETAVVLKTLLNSDNNDGNIVEKPFNSLDQKEAFFAIECLLKLQGNKDRSSLSGATRPDVSQTFDATTVEVAALYYVTYIFLQKWDHASAPFLIDKSRKQNSAKTVYKAYKSYKEWFMKVQRIGLEEARKQKLDPLSGTNVRWY